MPARHAFVPRSGAKNQPALPIATRTWLVPALLVIVLVTAGCTGLGPVFGGDVLKVQTKTVQDGVKDILVIRDVVTIPRSPILPGQPLTLSYVIENRDKLREARNVHVNLFNAPGFKNSAGRPCNAAGSQTACQPEGSTNEDRCIGAGCTILPGEEKLIVYHLIAPSEQEIVRVQTKTQLDFNVIYTFDAAFTIIAPVVNLEEIEKRQRSGDTTTLLISKAHSSGPIMIDVDIQGAPYFLWKRDGVLLFTIRDRGSGSVLNAQLVNYVGVGPLTIDNDTTPGFRADFDPAMPVSSATRSFPPIFVCDDRRNAVNGVVCVNQNKEIQLFKDASRVSMRFTLDTQNVLTDGVPFRSVEIKAKANYDYELRQSVPITINPFENV